jgi:KDO2-lipid IV(A) lauroyltransferase
MTRAKNKLMMYLEYWGLMIAVALTRIVSLRFSYVLVGLFAEFVFFIDRKHRNRVIDHLLFAEVCSDKKEAIKIGRENFKQFGYFMIELLTTKQLMVSRELSEYMSFSGSQESIKMFFEGKDPINAIVISAHYGNWEISAFTYILNSGHPLLSVMRKFDNPIVGDYIKGQRLAFNHTVCEKDGAMKKLMKALRKGESICMVADQHANRDEGVETTFFGKAVRTHASPAMLHLKTGVPILVGITKRVGVFKFITYVADPIIIKPTANKEADILKVTQSYTTALEKLIKENGIEQWMWAHRRWLDLRKKTVRKETVEK